MRRFQIFFLTSLMVASFTLIASAEPNSPNSIKTKAHGKASGVQAHIDSQKRDLMHPPRKNDNRELHDPQSRRTTMGHNQPDMDHFPPPPPGTDYQDQGEKAHPGAHQRKRMKEMKEAFKNKKQFHEANNDESHNPPQFKEFMEHHNGETPKEALRDAKKRKALKQFKENHGQQNNEGTSRKERFIAKAKKHHAKEKLQDKVKDRLKNKAKYKLNDKKQKNQKKNKLNNMRDKKGHGLSHHNTNGRPSPGNLKNHSKAGKNKLNNVKRNHSGNGNKQSKANRPAQRPKK